MLIDGNEAAAGSVTIKDKKIAKNVFLSPQKLNDFLNTMATTNKYYPYLKATVESIKDSPSIVDGKVLVIDQNYLKSSIGIGQHTVTLQFNNGMELSASLEVYETTPVLKASYSFEEEAASNRANDSSVNLNNGTISGTVERVQGVKGKALGFNGTNAHVEIPNSSSLSSFGDELYIDFWVNPANAEGARQLVNKRVVGGTEGFMVDLVANNFVRFTAGGGSNVVQSKNPIPVNEWSHITATYKNKTLALYMNGKLENTLILSATPVLNNTRPLRLGIHSTNVDRFKGYMDEILIWNGILADTTPNVEFTNIIGNEEQVPVNQQLEIYYDKSISPGENFAKIELKKENEVIPATVQMTDFTLTVKPESLLDFGTEYKLTVPLGAIENSADGQIASSFTMKLKTEAGVSPADSLPALHPSLRPRKGL